MFNFNYDTVLSVSHLETNFQVLSMTHCQFCLTFLCRMKFLFSYLFVIWSKHCLIRSANRSLSYVLNVDWSEQLVQLIWKLDMSRYGCFISGPIWTSICVIKLKLVMFRQYFFRRQPEIKKCKFKMVLKTSLSLSR